MLRNAFPGEREIIGLQRSGVLASRVQVPCLLELIWSYWHEEGMLVQSIERDHAGASRTSARRATATRSRTSSSTRCGRSATCLWGYIQDEQNLLTVKRRAYEYDHQYGLALYGKAVPPLRPADSRSKFLEAFHHLLHRCSLFYKEDNDTTVIADGFPLLNALKEVHLLLAEGAHNQFGDLPWTARGEMLIQQWLLSRPEMRDFLQGRRMVPYKEPWMAQVDTMKSLQGWTDIPVTHFRDLGVYGEQILLSIRYGDWIDINNEDAAKNWARSWRPEIQSYLHAYRAVTGMDLTNPTPSTTPCRRSTCRSGWRCNGHGEDTKMRMPCACGCCGTCAQQPRDPTISEGTMNRFEAQGLGDFEFEAFDGAEFEDANFGEAEFGEGEFGEGEFLGGEFEGEWEGEVRDHRRRPAPQAAVRVRDYRRPAVSRPSYRPAAWSSRSRSYSRRLDGERERAMGPVRCRVRGPAPGRVPGPLPHTVLRGNSTGGDSRACHRNGIGAVNIRAGIGGSDKVRASPARRRAGAATGRWRRRYPYGRYGSGSAYAQPDYDEPAEPPYEEPPMPPPVIVAAPPPPPPRRRWRSRPSSRRRRKARRQAQAQAKAEEFFIEPEAFEFDMELPGYEGELFESGFGEFESGPSPLPDPPVDKNPVNGCGTPGRPFDDFAFGSPTVPAKHGPRIQGTGSNHRQIVDHQYQNCDPYRLPRRPYRRHREGK